MFLISFASGQESFRMHPTKSSSWVDEAHTVAVCQLPFTGIVNNTNLGPQTTAETVLGSVPYANEVAALNNLSILCRKTNRFDEAVKLAEAAARICPDSEEVQKTLADAKAKKP